MDMDRVAQQLIECSSTPLLHRILQDARDLHVFSSERSDTAAAAFFDVVIGLVEAEISKRGKL